MPRIPRVVIPGIAHHVTQRGNRRQPTFLREFDYELYRQLLAEQCEKEQVANWAYCLLPNHVHLILVPSDPGGLSRVMSVAHFRYTSRINRREGWKGCLWQGRFSSFPMDELHLHAAARYVLLNPVRAGLAKEAIDWPHSSLRAHLDGTADGLVDVSGLGCRIPDWNSFLGKSSDWSERTLIRRHECSGFPLGDEPFLHFIETQSGRKLEQDCSWIGRPGWKDSRVEILGLKATATTDQT
jgi:putative transposase